MRRRRSRRNSSGRTSGGAASACACSAGVTPFPVRSGMPVVFAVGPCAGPRRRPPRAFPSSPAPRSPERLRLLRGRPFAWRLRAAGLFAILVEGKSPAGRPRRHDRRRGAVAAEDLWTKGVGRRFAPCRTAEASPPSARGGKRSPLLKRHDGRGERGGRGAWRRPGKEELKAVTWTAIARCRLSTGTVRPRRAMSAALPGLSVIFGELGISEYGTPRWSTSCASGGWLPRRTSVARCSTVPPATPARRSAPRTARRRKAVSAAHPLQEAGVRRTFLAGV